MINEKESIDTVVITASEAKSIIQSMNLINGFLLDSVLENEEDAKVLASYILSTVYNRKIAVETVTSQKVFQAVDTQYHSIRLDAHIKPVKNSSDNTATIYDVEMEDRESDRPDLPKRFRYYGALHDTKYLGASTNYRSLPDFVSITISSYDPFGAGDMYYEAGTILKTHPSIPYNDGLNHIFLYCYGNPNLSDVSHSKKMSEMLKYIISGEKPSSPCTEIENIDEIVSRVKSLPEVTSRYMRQWDREQTLQLEASEKTERFVNEVYSWLYDHDRDSDVSKAVKDSAYRSKLFKEYKTWKATQN